MKKIIVTFSLVTSLMFAFTACKENEDGAAPIKKENRLDEVKKLLTAHKWKVLSLVSDSLGKKVTEPILFVSCSSQSSDDVFTDMTFSENGLLVLANGCIDSYDNYAYQLYIDANSNIIINFNKDKKGDFISQMMIKVLTENKLELALEPIEGEKSLIGIKASKNHLPF